MSSTPMGQLASRGYHLFVFSTAFTMCASTLHRSWVTKASLAHVGNCSKENYF